MVKVPNIYSLKGDELYRKTDKLPSILTIMKIAKEEIVWAKKCTDNYLKS